MMSKHQSYERHSVGAMILVSAILASTCFLGCQIPVSEGVARAACAYLTDEEFENAQAVTRFAINSGLSKADYVGLAEVGCAEPGEGITSQECESCVQAVADLVYGS